VKEHLQGKRFESEDDIDTAVTASLKRPSKNEYRAAINCLPRRWEKCVDSAGDYIESDMGVYIQEYQQYFYLVFCYYNKIIHKASELANIHT
jgi:hypothetical protein